MALREDCYRKDKIIAHDWFPVPSLPELHSAVDRKSFNESLKEFWVMPSGKSSDLCVVGLSKVVAGESDVVVDRTLEERFCELADRWDRETAHLSSPTQRFANPSYQAVLGMGNDHREEVIDLLLRDMQQNRREWFWALSYLTHENPIERKDAGSLDKMIEAWARWGKQRRRGLQ